MKVLQELIHKAIKATLCHCGFLFLNLFKHGAHKGWKAIVNFYTINLNDALNEVIRFCQVQFNERI